jgi:hypothetical protein
MSKQVTVPVELLKNITKEELAKQIKASWEQEEDKSEWQVVEATVGDGNIFRTSTVTIKDANEAEGWLNSKIIGSAKEPQHKLSLIETYILAAKAKVRTAPAPTPLPMDFLEAVRRLNIETEAATLTAARALMESRENQNHLKDCKIPPFHGNKDEDVDDWLYMVNTFVITRKIADEDILPAFSSLLRGNALSTFRKFQRDHPQEQFDWRVFSPILRGRFESVDSQRKLRHELRELSAKIGLRQYINKFEAISCKVRGLDEKELVLQFCEGLQQKMKFEVITKHPRTVVEAIQIALLYEECADCRTTEYKSNSIRRINYSKYQPGQRRFFKGKNYKGGKPSDFKRKPPYNGGSNNPGGSNSGGNNSKPGTVICHKCKKPGHYARDCRVTQHRSNEVKVMDHTQQADNKQSPKIVTSCTYAADANALLSTVGRMNGKSIRFAFDSGATASILSKKVLEKNPGLTTVRESDIQLKAANNDVSPVLGITDHVEIDIDGHTCKLQLLVTDHEDHEVLLGLDWFRETGAGIFPLTKLLKFPAHKISLEEHDDGAIGFEEYENQVIVCEVETRYEAKPEAGDDSDIEEESSITFSRRSRIFQQKASSIWNRRTSERSESSTKKLRNCGRL